MSEEFRVYEEDFKIVWAMTAFGSGLIGIYFLNTSFGLFSLFIKMPVVILSLVFFTFSFYAAFKAAEDLHEVSFQVVDGQLTIKIFKKNEIIKSESLALDKIQYLLIEPRIKPKSGEAVYDYTSNYFLRFQTLDCNDILSLINLGNYTMSLKLEDIERLIQFIQKYQPNIKVMAGDLDFNEPQSTI